MLFRLSPPACCIVVLGMFTVPVLAALSEQATATAEPLFTGDNPGPAAARAAARASSGDAGALFVWGFLSDIGAGASLDHPKALERVREAAEKGHQQARLYLAWRYASGFGAEGPDRDEAERWRSLSTPAARESDVPELWFELTADGLAPKFSRALFWMMDRAEAGDVIAQANLAQVYLETSWTAPDTELHLHWLRRAGENGHAPSLERLMLYHSTGAIVGQDEAQAVRYRLAAAEAGSALAQYLQGLALIDGAPIEVNVTEAVRWLRLAADQDYLDALIRLGQLHRDGAPGLAKDLPEAVRWFERAAELGSVDALTELGELHRHGDPSFNDVAKASRYFEEAAEKGHAPAAYALGKLLLDGEAVEERRRQGVQWLQRAADSGSIEAMRDLASFYSEGTQTERDLALAFEWLERAAREGDTWSQLKVGAMLRDGEGIERDVEEAIVWFEAAIQNGEPAGHSQLAYLYAEGLGVESDLLRALTHLTEASRTLNDAWLVVSMHQAFAKANETERRSLLQHLQACASEPELMDAEGSLPESCLTLLEAHSEHEAARGLLDRMKESRRPQSLLLVATHAFHGLNMAYDLTLARDFIRQAETHLPQDSARLSAEIESIAGGTPEARAAACEALQRLADAGDFWAAWRVVERGLSGMNPEFDLETARRYYDIAAKSAPHSLKPFETLQQEFVSPGTLSAEAVAEKKAQLLASRDPTKDARPQPIVLMHPHYPVDLRRSGLEGMAVVDFTVDLDGIPQNVRAVESSHPLFGATAEACIRRWRFVPGQRNGKPAATALRQPLQFKLQE